MFKPFIRSPLFTSAVGAVAYGWLKLVQKTTRFECDPVDFRGAMLREHPKILAMWHGQHLINPFSRPAEMRISALISRSEDAEINAYTLRRFGIELIRGAGGSAAKMHKRGGFAAMREMLRALGAGSTVALTADVPKVARVCGEGIVTLARISSRPIYPIAVVCRWRIDFRSWDRMSLALPFGRGAMVLGPPVRVSRDADPAALEEARQAVERGLNEAHARAYGMLGSFDPGADLARNPRRVGASAG